VRERQFEKTLDDLFDISLSNTMSIINKNILFIKEIYIYKNNNKRIAETALKKFINHLWYFSDECVTLSIFDM